MLALRTAVLTLVLTGIGACAVDPPAGIASSATAIGDTCPPGTTAVATTPYEPGFCMLPDGRRHGPAHFHDFDEATRTWSATRGTYREGRREGEWLTRGPMGEIIEVRHYQDDQLRRLELYRPTRIDELDRGGLSVRRYGDSDHVGAGRYECVEGRLTQTDTSANAPEEVARAWREWCR